MPETFSESTAITIKVGWLIAIVTLLMGLASTGGVLAYQVRELTLTMEKLSAQRQADLDAMARQAKEMSAQRTADREALIALTASLQGRGVLK